MSVVARRYTPPPYMQIDATTASISLTRGQVAIVDLDDATRLSRYIWYACGTGNYLRAQRMEKRQGIYMHHDILLLVPGMEVDHIDGNRLNNKKSNLRLVEHVDNMRNANTLKSRVGVCFNQRAKLWMAYIDEFDKKRVYLGYRRTREEALRLVEIAKCS